MFSDNIVGCGMLWNIPLEGIFSGYMLFYKVGPSVAIRSGKVDSL